jgi:hypothetical protein
MCCRGDYVLLKFLIPFHVGLHSLCDAQCNIRQIPFFLLNHGFLMFDVPFVGSMSLLRFTAFMYGRDYQSYKKLFYLTETVNLLRVHFYIWNANLIKLVKTQFEV